MHYTQYTYYRLTISGVYNYGRCIHARERRRSRARGSFRLRVQPQTNNKCTSYNNVFILNDRLEIRTKQSTQPVSINCQVRITWSVIYVCYT